MNLTNFSHAIEDFLKHLCMWCFIRIGPEQVAHEESEDHVLGSFFGVAELEHQVGNELVQQQQL